MKVISTALPEFDTQRILFNSGVRALSLALRRSVFLRPCYCFTSTPTPANWVNLG